MKPVRMDVRMKNVKCLLVTAFLVNLGYISGIVLNYVHNNALTAGVNKTLDTVLDVKVATMAQIVLACARKTAKTNYAIKIWVHASVATKIGTMETNVT